MGRARTVSLSANRKRNARDKLCHEEISPVYLRQAGNSLPNQMDRLSSSAEQFVQTLKKLFKKAEEDCRDPYLALPENPNTPITGLESSPAQHLMSRDPYLALPEYPNTPITGLESSPRTTSHESHPLLQTTHCQKATMPQSSQRS